MKKGVIYSITCPMHNNIFYVGKTLDLEKRIRYYFSPITHKTTSADLYVKKLHSIGKKPIFTIHDKCDELQLGQQEHQLISECLAKGLLLLNWNGSNKNNYNLACEFYLGVPIPDLNSKVEVIDLTLQAITK
jgi:GIY-YIG catalytic domain